MGQQYKRVIGGSPSVPMAWVPSPASQKRKRKICKVFLDLAFCFPIKEMEGSGWIVVRFLSAGKGLLLILWKGVNRPNHVKSSVLG